MTDSFQPHQIIVESLLIQQLKPPPTLKSDSTRRPLNKQDTQKDPTGFKDYSVIVDDLKEPREVVARRTSQNQSKTLKNKILRNDQSSSSPKRLKCISRHSSLGVEKQDSNFLENLYETKYDKSNDLQSGHNQGDMNKSKPQSPQQKEKTLEYPFQSQSANSSTNRLERPEKHQSNQKAKQLRPLRITAYSFNSQSNLNSPYVSGLETKLNQSVLDKIKPIDPHSIIIKEIPSEQKTFEERKVVVQNNIMPCPWNDQNIPDHFISYKSSLSVHNSKAQLYKHNSATKSRSLINSQIQDSGTFRANVSLRGRKQEIDEYKRKMVEKIRLEKQINSALIAQKSGKDLRQKQEMVRANELERQVSGNSQVFINHQRSIQTNSNQNIKIQPVVTLRDIIGFQKHISSNPSSFPASESNFLIHEEGRWNKHVDEQVLAVIRNAGDQQISKLKKQNTSLKDLKDIEASQELHLLEDETLLQKYIQETENLFKDSPDQLGQLEPNVMKIREGNSILSTQQLKDTPPIDLQREGQTQLTNKRNDSEKQESVGNGAERAARPLTLTPQLMMDIDNSYHSKIMQDPLKSQLKEWQDDSINRSKGVASFMEVISQRKVKDKEKEEERQKEFEKIADMMERQSLQSMGERRSNLRKMSTLDDQIDGSIQRGCQNIPPLSDSLEDHPLNNRQSRFDQSDTKEQILKLAGRTCSSNSSELKLQVNKQFTLDKRHQLPTDEGRGTEGDRILERESFDSSPDVQHSLTPINIPPLQMGQKTIRKQIKQVTYNPIQVKNSNIVPIQEDTALWTGTRRKVTKVESRSEKPNKVEYITTHIPMQILESQEKLSIVNGRETQRNTDNGSRDRVQTVEDRENRVIDEIVQDFVDYLNNKQSPQVIQFSATQTNVKSFIKISDEEKSLKNQNLDKRLVKLEGTADGQNKGMLKVTVPCDDGQIETITKLINKHFAIQLKLDKYNSMAARSPIHERVSHIIHKSDHEVSPTNSIQQLRSNQNIQQKNNNLTSSQNILGLNIFANNSQKVNFRPKLGILELTSQEALSGAQLRIIEHKESVKKLREFKQWQKKEEQIQKVKRLERVRSHIQYQDLKNYDQFLAQDQSVQRFNMIEGGSLRSELKRGQTITSSDKKLGDQRILEGEQQNAFELGFKISKEKIDQTYLLNPSIRDQDLSQRDRKSENQSNFNTTKRKSVKLHQDSINKWKLNISPESPFRQESGSLNQNIPTLPLNQSSISPNFKNLTEITDIQMSSTMRVGDGIDIDLKPNRSGDRKIFPAPQKIEARATNSPTSSFQSNSMRRQVIVKHNKDKQIQQSRNRSRGEKSSKSKISHKSSHKFNLSPSPSYQVKETQKIKLPLDASFRGSRSVLQARQSFNKDLQQITSEMIDKTAIQNKTQPKFCKKLSEDSKEVPLVKIQLGLTRETLPLKSSIDAQSITVVPEDHKPLQIQIEVPTPNNKIVSGQRELKNDQKSPQSQSHNGVFGVGFKSGGIGINKQKKSESKLNETEGGNKKFLPSIDTIFEDIKDYPSPSSRNHSQHGQRESSPSGFQFLPETLNQTKQIPAQTTQRVKIGLEDKKIQMAGGLKVIKKQMETRTPISDKMNMSTMYLHRQSRGRQTQQDTHSFMGKNTVNESELLSKVGEGAIRIPTLNKSNYSLFKIPQQRSFQVFQEEPNSSVESHERKVEIENSSVLGYLYKLASGNKEAELDSQTLKQLKMDKESMELLTMIFESVKSTQKEDLSKNASSSKFTLSDNPIQRMQGLELKVQKLQGLGRDLTQSRLPKIKKGRNSVDVQMRTIQEERVQMLTILKEQQTQMKKANPVQHRRASSNLEQYNFMKKPNIEDLESVQESQKIIKEKASENTVRLPIIKGSLGARVALMEFGRKQSVI